MDDLASLMRYAPGIAGMFAGQQQAVDTQSKIGKMQELSQLMQIRQSEEQRALEKHPLEMEQTRFMGQRAQAQARDYDAQALERSSEAKRKATKDEEDRKRKNFGDVMSQVGVLADHIDRQPDALKHQSLMDALDMIQTAPENKQRLLQYFGQYKGPDLGKEMRRISDQFLKSNAAYVKQAAINDSREAVGEGHDGARVRAAEIRGPSGSGGKGGKKDTDWAGASDDDLYNGIMKVVKGAPQTMLAQLNRFAADAEAQGKTALAARLRRQAQEVGNTEAQNPARHPRAGDVVPPSARIQTRPPVAPYVTPAPGASAPAQPTVGQLKSGNKFQIIKD